MSNFHKVISKNRDCAVVATCALTGLSKQRVAMALGHNGQIGTRIENMEAGLAFLTNELWLQLLIEQPFPLCEIKLDEGIVILSLPNSMLTFNILLAKAAGLTVTHAVAVKDELVYDSIRKESTIDDIMWRGWNVLGYFRRINR